MNKNTAGVRVVLIYLETRDNDRVIRRLTCPVLPGERVDIGNERQTLSQPLLNQWLATVTYCNGKAERFKVLYVSERRTKGLSAQQPV